MNACPNCASRKIFEVVGTGGMGRCLRCGARWTSSEAASPAPSGDAPVRKPKARSVTLSVPGLSGFETALGVVGDLIRDLDAVVIDYAMGTQVGSISLRLSTPAIRKAVWVDTVARSGSLIRESERKLERLRESLVEARRLLQQVRAGHTLVSARRRFDRQNALSPPAIG